jgi:hypothetical protein
MGEVGVVMVERLDLPAARPAGVTLTAAVLAIARLGAGMLS